MKQYNKFLNILNIFHSIGFLLIYAVAYFFNIYIIYNSFETALMTVPVVIIVFDAIVSVINLIKRNIKNGIIRYSNSC